MLLLDHTRLKVVVPPVICGIVYIFDDFVWELVKLLLVKGEPIISPNPSLQSEGLHWEEPMCISWVYKVVICMGLLCYRTVGIPSLWGDTRLFG